MEKALRIVMPWLSAQDVGELGCTCRAMAEAARCVTAHRVGDATQGWEAISVPVENHVDDCVYPDFQYTPFSRVSSPSAFQFGGPWGGSGVMEEWRKRGVSESEFGGAIIAGSVLHGAGIGCSCPNDCSMECQDFSDCWSADCDCSSEEDADGAKMGAWRINYPVARRDPHAQTLEILDEGFEKKSRFQEHTGDRPYAQWGLYDEINDQESFEEVTLICKTESTNKRKRLPLQASSCPCGRFIGGKLAYVSNSWPCTQRPNTQASPAEQVHVGSQTFGVLEVSRNSVQVQRDVQLTMGKAFQGIHEPPLVMECGQVCSCSNLCRHRLSQNGLAVRVKVVRTSFKGWGLCALQKINQGSFVCEYAGELITIQKARERQLVYDSEKHGKHWQGSALLTVREHLPSGQASVRVNVDATKIGNVARFINHSCDGGNLIRCLIRIAGCIIPKLALFARTDIPSGEELTYSYGKTHEHAETSKPCLCGTSACLGWLPSEST